MSTATEPVTLPFDVFWSWLLGHPNCILRAGTPESVLYDDDDLHWFFATEASFLVVQLMHGKRPLGELFLDPEQVTYVEGQPGEQEGEFVFELISEGETERLATYFFVLVHGYDEEQDDTPHQRVH